MESLVHMADDPKPETPSNGSAPGGHPESSGGAAAAASDHAGCRSDAIGPGNPSSANPGALATCDGAPITGGTSPNSNVESRDVALIHGVTEAGHLKILRQREDQIELGVLQPIREGAPIRGEVVSLTPRKEFPLLCDVKTEFAPSAPAAASDSAAKASPARPVAPEDAARLAPRRGPAQVATDEYRANWDRIWNKKSTPGNLPN